MIKDPYTFDFLELAADATERQLERGLVAHISQFLLELGLGFAYVGRQYRLSVGGDEFFLDLLFYHLRLRCFVVIELKIEEFKPEFAGKMNFYLSAVDDLLRHPDDGRRRPGGAGQQQLPGGRRAGGPAAPLGAATREARLVGSLLV